LVCLDELVISRDQALVVKLEQLESDAGDLTGEQRLVANAFSKR
jgi:hypothetical protein